MNLSSSHPFLGEGVLNRFGLVFALIPFFLGWVSFLHSWFPDFTLISFLATDNVKMAIVMLSLSGSILMRLKNSSLRSPFLLGILPVIYAIPNLNPFIEHGLFTFAESVSLIALGAASLLLYIDHPRTAPVAGALIGVGITTAFLIFSGSGTKLPNSLGWYSLVTGELLHAVSFLFLGLGLAVVAWSESALSPSLIPRWVVPSVFGIGVTFSLINYQVESGCSLHAARVELGQKVEEFRRRLEAEIRPVTMAVELWANHHANNSTAASKSFAKELVSRFSVAQAVSVWDLNKKTLKFSEPPAQPRQPPRAPAPDELFTTDGTLVHVPVDQETVWIGVPVKAASGELEVVAAEIPLRSLVSDALLGWPGENLSYAVHADGLHLIGRPLEPGVLETRTRLELPGADWTIRLGMPAKTDSGARLLFWLLVALSMVAMLVLLEGKLIATARIRRIQEHATHLEFSIGRLDENRNQMKRRLRLAMQDRSRLKRTLRGGAVQSLETIQHASALLLRKELEKSETKHVKNIFETASQLLELAGKLIPSRNASKNKKEKAA